MVNLFFGNILMTDQNQKPALSDLIDIAFLQKFQDLFAETMGVASIAVDDKGPITKPSNFTDFCIKYTRGSEEGYKRCNACDIKWGEFAAKSGKPAIYKCHSGLVDFAVPIVVGGKHVASILGGQVLEEKPDENHFRELARELGIDEDEYITAVRKIKIIKREQIEAAVKFMHLVANAISKIAHKNYLVNKKSQREKLLTDVINKIRSSLDVNEILYFICEEVVRLFNVQRAAIAVFPRGDKFKEYQIKEEYSVFSETSVFPNTPAASATAAYWRTGLSSSLSKVLAFDDISESEAPDYFKEVYEQMSQGSGAMMKKVY